MKKQFLLDNISNFSELRKLQIVLENNLQDVEIRINKDTSVLSVSFEDNKEEEVISKIKELVNESSDTIALIEREIKPLQRRILFLKDLDCANCAAKIERIARKEFDHELITVDFATQRFIIETTDEELLNNLQERLSRITDIVDSNINVEKLEATQKETGPRVFKIDKRRKLYFIIGISIFLVDFIFKTIYHIITKTDASTHEWYISLIIYAAYMPAYILLGGDVLLGALKNIKNGRFFDEKFLMSMATIAALAVGYYDEAIFVMLFYKIGELCQQYAVNYSRNSITSLIDIRPQFANVEINEEIIQVVPNEVVKGDIIIVKPGERVPLDGVVIEGETEIDTSAITGESMYREVKVGDRILSSAINVGGIIKIVVDKEYSDSMVYKILNLIENASSQKSKSENFISKFAKLYTPIVVILAILIIFIQPVLYNDFSWLTGFKESIYTATIFLVISCPCALVISIPLGFFGGIGGASRQGILIKGSNYLEALNNINTIVFDKTGTLTKGKFIVDEIVPVKGYTKKEVLEYCAYAESVSSHPIARSIIEAYGKPIDTSKIRISETTTGIGAVAFINEHHVIVGKDALLEKNNIAVPKGDFDRLAIHCAVDSEYIGYILVIDEIKQEAASVIKELKTMSLDAKKTIMFTGDSEMTAQRVAAEIGIEEYHANMSPIDKVNKLRRLKLKQPKNKKIAFVGDGINDAPVLGIADVGIAMGNFGSAAAIEVADIVLMTDEVTKIPIALKIARKTRKIVLENIILALTVKLSVMILAVLPISINFLIIEAIFADVGVSLLAILNSLRAMKYKAKDQVSKTLQTRNV